MDDPQVETLIETIYASAFKNDGWDRLLLTLRTQFHASHASAAVFNGIEEYPLFFSTLDPASLKLYGDYFNLLDPVHPVNHGELRNCTGLPPGFTIEAIMEPAEWVNSEFYCDFVQKCDIGQPLISFLNKTDQSFSFIVVQRPSSGQDYCRKEKTLMATLSPHLNRGIRMFCELTELHTSANLFETAFDALGAAFLLDTRGRVLTMNKGAGQLLEGHGVLSIVEGRLGASHPSDDAVLAAAFAPSRPGAPPVEIILRGPAHALGLRLAVTPVKGRNIPLFGKLAQGEQVAFMVTAAALGPSLQNLMALYGLTRAEAEVALLLSEGLRAPQIAAHRETSIGTVNTQLKQIYAKTGVDGQVALIVKLLGR